MWRFELTGPALKDLQKLDKKAIGRILDGLDQFVRSLSDPALPAQSDVRRVVGTVDHWRLRKGDYRIRFTLDEQKQLITVLHVRHRREAYR